MFSRPRSLITVLLMTLALAFGTSRDEPARIARHIDKLLRRELGSPVDPERMVEDRLYARDVLLVCEEHSLYVKVDSKRLTRSDLERLVSL